MVLRDSKGSDVTDAVPGNGEAVAVVQLASADGAVIEEFPRNQWGGFFQVFQPNKWQIKRRELESGQAAKETIMV